MNIYSNKNSVDEIWKDIIGYKNLYKISNLGKVKSLKRNIILKSNPDKKGYLRVNLCKNGIVKTFLVHRLVAEAFIKNTYNAPCVDHIDTITSNNKVENLRWVNYKENNNNNITVMKNSLAKTKEKHPLYGKHHKKSTIIKMKESSNRKEILQFTKDDVFVKKWESSCEIERETKIPHGNILKCCNKDRKSAGGYIWKYKNY